MKEKVVVQIYENQPFINIYNSDMKHTNRLEIEPIREGAYIMSMACQETCLAPTPPAPLRAAPEVGEKARGRYWRTIEKGPHSVVISAKEY